MHTVHFVVPDAVNDMACPSGGNIYDRRVRDGLAESGWHVREHLVCGAWPAPGPDMAAPLSRAIGTLPRHSLVLIDGLIASAAARILVPLSRRLRLVVLAHMPGWHDDEGAVLRSAAAVVATSDWTRKELIARHGLPERVVRVARPGVDAVAQAAGGRDTLLSVGAVSRVKGQDVLVDAVARLRDISGWQLRCVGPLDREPGFADTVRSRAGALGIAERIDFDGVLLGADVDAAYATSAAVIVPSRAETFGLVVSEALAHGLPVVASDVGGIPEALGSTSLGRPGLLVAPDHERELAEALRSWLEDTRLRRGLQAAARERRTTLTSWRQTVERIATALRMSYRGGWSCDGGAG